MMNPTGKHWGFRHYVILALCICLTFMGGMIVIGFFGPQLTPDRISIQFQPDSPELELKIQQIREIMEHEPITCDEFGIYSALPPYENGGHYDVDFSATLQSAQEFNGDFNQSIWIHEIFLFFGGWGNESDYQDWISGYFQWNESNWQCAYGSTAWGFDENSTITERFDPMKIFLPFITAQNGTIVTFQCNYNYICGSLCGVYFYAAGLFYFDIDENLTYGITLQSPIAVS